MRRLFTKISSAALLFCLASHHSFSMKPGEEASERRPSREASLPIIQRSSPEERGASQSNTEASLPVKRRQCNFIYPTFKDAYFDLIDVKFPQFLKAEGLKEKVSLERFLSLCDGYLEKMKVPFVLALEDLKDCLEIMPTAVASEEDLSLYVPAVLIHPPRTRDDNLKKRSQLDEAISLMQGQSSFRPLLTGDLTHRELMKLSINICQTRVNLLQFKREALSEDKDKEKEALLTNAVQTYRKYLLYIESFRAAIQYPHTYIFFLEHKRQALDGISDVLFDFAHFYIFQDRRADYIKIWTIREAYMSLNVTISSEYQRIYTNENIVKAHALLLGNLYASSIRAYGYYFQINPEEAREAHKRAVVYNLQIKDLGPQYNDIYKKEREILDDMQIGPCGVLGDGKLARQEIERIKQLLILSQYAPETIEGAVYVEHRKIISIIRGFFKKQDRSAEEIKKIQDQIALYENKFLGRERSSSLGISEIDEFYQKYERVLGKKSDEISHANNILVNFFIISGQFERGLNHINSFKKIYEGPEQIAIGIKSAYLKALQGDPEELLALDEAYLSKQENKAKKKERQRKRIVSAIHAEQEISAQSKSSKEIQSSSSSLEGRQRISTFHVSEPSSYKLSLASSEIAPSTEEEKEKKRERHHEKLEERRKEFEQEALRDQGAAAVVDEDAEEARGGAQAEATVVREDTWFPFGENIELKTLQKRVDLEIEEKSWNFTKLDLERYYEEFGCKVSQNGRHTKVALPDYKGVRLPDGTPLSVIFGEVDAAYEGGAFTLPNWQDQVPFYLRKQIFKARGKIQDYFDLLDRAKLRQFEQKREG